MPHKSIRDFADTPYCKFSGVYEIGNILNGKRYIGSAVSFHKRWMNHLSELRRNKNNCRLLQNAWNKYGEESFCFRVVMTCEIEDLINYEAAIIRHYESNDRRKGYNISEASNRLGCRHTEESKAKMSASLVGRKQSKESIEARAASLRGRIASEETRNKLRKPKSQLTKDRMSAAQKLRFQRNPMSEESLAKMSASKRGKPAHNRGTKASTEARAKMSASRMGRAPWNKGRRMAIEQTQGIAEA